VINDWLDIIGQGELTYRDCTSKYDEADEKRNGRVSIKPVWRLEFPDDRGGEDDGNVWVEHETWIRCNEKFSDYLSHHQRDEPRQQGDSYYVEGGLVADLRYDGGGHAASTMKESWSTL